MIHDGITFCLSIKMWHHLTAQHKGFYDQFLESFIERLGGNGYTDCGLYR